MKILSSDLTFTSDHRYRQMDAVVNQRTAQRLPAARQSPAENAMDGSRAIVDRVSLSRDETVRYQSDYRAALSTASTVTAPVQESSVSLEQHTAMEKMVGALLDHEVVISDIKAAGTAPQRVDVPVSIAPATQNPAWEMRLNQTRLHFEAEQLSVSAAGQVVTEAGTMIEFTLDLNLDRTFSSRIDTQTIARRWQEQVNLTDPLVVSLDGQAPRLSNAEFVFDLNGDGISEQVHFVAPGSGFLAFDRNSDQRINDGSELFGPGSGNGFAELAALDLDQNQWIDENDAVFSQLSVWLRDEDGKDRLISLKDAGIGAIALDYAQGRFNLTDSHNTLMGQVNGTGVFLFENGSAGSISQVDLVSRPVADEPDLLSLPGLILQNASSAITEKWMPQIQENRFSPPDKKTEHSLQKLLEQVEKLKADFQRLYEKIDETFAKQGFRQG